MASSAKNEFLLELRKRTGELRCLPRSQSLFETHDGKLRLYIRYSKRHGGNRTFYGLRRDDLRQLDGRRAFICFVWDDQPEPLLIPYEKYEDLFRTVSPATDGQYKSQVFLRTEGVELYISGCGRFNVESHIGWNDLNSAVNDFDDCQPQLNHSQIQTLLGAIGAAKGFQIWIPQNDRQRLDWTMVPRFELASTLPSIYQSVSSIAEQIDVIWLLRGSGVVQSLFEVEHSTTIYSGLLRFNDIHLVAPLSQSRYNVVGEDVRRSRFVRQLSRPTFQRSGLHELCSFLEYSEVYAWYKRLNAASW